MALASTVAVVAGRTAERSAVELGHEDDASSSEDASTTAVLVGMSLVTSIVGEAAAEELGTSEDVRTSDVDISAVLVSTWELSVLLVSNAEE